MLEISFAAREREEMTGKSLKVAQGHCPHCALLECGLVWFASSSSGTCKVLAWFNPRLAYVASFRFCHAPYLVGHALVHCVSLKTPGVLAHFCTQVSNLLLERTFVVV
jgi:hypothetical protein